MDSIHKRMSSHSLTKALMGEKEDNEDDSVNTKQDAAEDESMFAMDINKKAGKPVRGYRWMCFTFTMIIILCIMVFFHSSLKKIKDDYLNRCICTEPTVGGELVCKYKNGGDECTDEDKVGAKEAFKKAKEDKAKADAAAKAKAEADEKARKEAEAAAANEEGEGEEGESEEGENPAEEGEGGATEEEEGEGEAAAEEDAAEEAAVEETVAEEDASEF